MILEQVQKTALLLTLIKGKTYKENFPFFLLLGVKINMGNCLSINIFCVVYGPHSVCAAYTPVQYTSLDR